MWHLLEGHTDLVANVLCLTCDKAPNRYIGHKPHPLRVFGRKIGVSSVCNLQKPPIFTKEVGELPGVKDMWQSLEL